LVAAVAVPTELRFSRTITLLLSALKSVGPVVEGLDVTTSWAQGASLVQLPNRSLRNKGTAVPVGVRAAIWQVLAATAAEALVQVPLRSTGTPHQASVLVRKVRSPALLSFVPVAVTVAAQMLLRHHRREAAAALLIRQPPQVMVPSTPEAGEVDDIGTFTPVPTMRAAVEVPVSSFCAG
jgi:hypothetical protein